MTGFGEETVRFLIELRANNSREWFENHRDTYHLAVRDAANFFALNLSQLLEAKTGTPHSHRIFRIHRDLRFSKDKTPYKTHIHMLARPVGGHAAWMFGLEPGKLTFGAGEMTFERDRLLSWRNRVSGPDGKELADRLAALSAAGCRLAEPELRRVPPPFAGNHPRADLLRRKSLAIWRDVPDTGLCFGRDGPSNCLGELLAFEPIAAWLNSGRMRADS